MNGGVVQFNEGETQKTHTILINDNIVCGEQTFFSNIALNAGLQPIHIVKPQATITINDSNEEDCSEFCTKACPQYHYELFFRLHFSWLRVHSIYNY